MAHSPALHLYDMATLMRYANAEVVKVVFKRRAGFAG
jgi:hypothetical protein